MKKPAVAASAVATISVATRCSARSIVILIGRRASSLYPLELRDLPSVDELTRGLDDPLAVAAARAVLDRAREEIRAGAEPGDLAARLQEELRSARAPRLRRVLNATGVIVHTNLGRAPLAEE